MRWYQTVFIDGVDDIVYEDINRRVSRFWNEGKWNNFIKPLLTDIDKGSFLEIGCNAGLFLKMAKDEGFKNVIGIEASKRVFQQAELYQKSIKGDYTIVRQAVNKDFSLEQYPLLDVVLLANTHYYIPLPDFARLVDQMRSRSVHCIIVSGKTRKWAGNACSDLGSVRGYFRDWQEIKLVQGINQEGDPSPRPEMYGVLFKGALTKMSIDGILGRWRENIKPVDGVVIDPLSPVYEDFYKRVLSRKPFDFKDVPYYQFLKKNNPHQDTEEYMARKKALALDIQENGLKVPLFIDRNGTIIDGFSRIFILKELGHKNTFVRKM